MGEFLEATTIVFKISGYLGNASDKGGWVALPLLAGNFGYYPLKVGAMQAIMNSISSFDNLLSILPKIHL